MTMQIDQNSECVEKEWSRRELLTLSGAGTIAGVMLPGCATRFDGPGRVPTYEQLGVRPIINCQGAFTILGGSLMLPEVRAAMDAASRAYVHLDELMDAAGARLAELTGAEWGIVTAGCAAALCQVTAACVAGSDPEKMARLPDTSGMRNEVIVQPSHRHMYDHAIRMVGIRFIEVETREEMMAAISDRTAMIAMLGSAEETGRISCRETALIGKQYGVPTFVDAAAERPDVPIRYLEDGVDVVAFSGGKCLRGPQCSGLALGRKNILQAAFLNGAPHHALARPMKVGKEEIMGLLAAVEAWLLTRDHDAEWKSWEKWLSHIREAVLTVPGVTTEPEESGRAGFVPRMTIHWDRSIVHMTNREVHEALLSGDPRIQVPIQGDGLQIMPLMMEHGDATIVADRLQSILSFRTIA